MPKKPRKSRADFMPDTGKTRLDFVPDTSKSREDFTAEPESESVQGENTMQEVKDNETI